MSGHEANQADVRTKLLVIDDDPSTRILISDMLDDTGISIIETDRGTEAFEVFKNRRDEIGLILLDIYLPGCDGWTLIGMIRQIDQQIPVIVISALSPAELAAKYRSAGFTGYMTKPIEINRLKEIIITYLQAPDNR